MEICKFEITPGAWCTNLTFSQSVSQFIFTIRDTGIVWLTVAIMGKSSIVFLASGGSLPQCVTSGLEARR